MTNDPAELWPEPEHRKLVEEGRAGVVGLAEFAPRWDDNGDPITLSAAALDALDWLEWMRRYMASNTAVQWDQGRANLARCAETLRAKINDTISAPVQNLGTTAQAAVASSNAADECTGADSLSSANIAGQQTQPPASAHH